jgi:hypothetical protein
MNIDPFLIWLEATPLSQWVVGSPSMFAFPGIPAVHFIGLCLLIGSIGTFDLRLLGVAKRVPIASVHRFIPWGLAGFAINITTGAMFVLTDPISTSTIRRSTSSCCSCRSRDLCGSIVPGPARPGRRRCC